MGITLICDINSVQSSDPMSETIVTDWCQIILLIILGQCIQCPVMFLCIIDRPVPCLSRYSSINKLMNTWGSRLDAFLTLYCISLGHARLKPVQKYCF